MINNLKKIEIVEKQDHYYLLLPKDPLAMMFFNDFLLSMHSTEVFVQQRFKDPDDVFDIQPYSCYCVELRGEEGQKLDIFLFQMAEVFVNSRIDLAYENSWANNP